MDYNEFKAKAIVRHGDKYVYPEFKMTNHRDKIEIVCKEHGPFMQNLYAHLKGEGCPLCAGRRIFTTETFVDECKKKFGDKFDYSRTEYKGKREKVCILCEELITDENPEGIFWQYPIRHLDSNDGMLPKKKRGKSVSCKDPRITQSEFIDRLKGIFGDKYDYSKTVYRGSNQKCVVTCRKHGDFEALASNLLSKHGCPKCCKNHKLTLESFIEKATEKHNGKYTYEKVNFKNSNDKVTITCPIHGDFVQNVSHHLRGRGCQACARNKRLTTEEFVDAARKVHGDKYDYSNAEYVTHDTNVRINCPVHGEFMQTPSCHLRGQGCPFCGESHLENEVDLVLRKYGVEYVREKCFNEVSQKRPLPFDFFIPSINTVIECQGAQHFSPVEFFGNNIDERIDTDTIKKNKAEEQGIRVLYYTNVDNALTLIENNEKLQKIYNDNNLFFFIDELIKQLK